MKNNKIRILLLALALITLTGTSTISTAQTADSPVAEDVANAQAAYSMLATEKYIQTFQGPLAETEELPIAAGSCLDFNSIADLADAFWAPDSGPWTKTDTPEIEEALTFVSDATKSFIGGNFSFERLLGDLLSGLLGNLLGGVLGGAGGGDLFGVDCLQNPLLSEVEGALSCTGANDFESLSQVSGMSLKDFGIEGGLGVFDTNDELVGAAEATELEVVEPPIAPASCEEASPIKTPAGYSCGFPQCSSEGVDCLPVV